MDISVIIPCFNPDENLQTTIDSIKAEQKLQVELIIIDDGSPVNTGDTWVLQKTDFIEIKYFYQENSGPNKARELGIRKATSKHVTFIDSGDTFRPGALEILLKSIENNKTDIVQCDYSIVKPDNSYDSKDGNLNSKYCLDNNEAIGSLIKGEIYPFMWGKIYNRDILLDIDYPKLYASEDKLTLLKLFINGASISLIDLKLLNYIQDYESITRSKFSLKRMDDIYGKVLIKQLLNDDLAGIISKEICISCVRFSFQILETDFKNDSVLKNELRNYFKENYNNSKSSSILTSSERYLLMLYNINPKLSNVALLLKSKLI